ncbi:MAG: Ig-like domain-containing protein, partial [Candidatus Korobacteraceae bacterium]
MGSRILLGNRLFHSRILLFTLVLNGIVLLLAGRSAALCTLNPTSPSVTICSPANGATVTSPVSLVAGTTDTAYPVTAMKVYVDNVAVYSVKTNQLSTSLSLSAAKHNITVNAWDSSGTVFKGTSIVTVSGGAAPVSVSISPPSGTLIPGQTLQFTSTVLNTSNTAVNWSVDGVAAPGNPTVGMITSSGLYTAGTALGNHTVVATSAADSTKSASATVTVNAPPPVSVTVTPGTASIGVNATQQFTATVQNTTNTGVTWAVDTIAGGNTTVGTITGAGNTVTYTAPATAGPHTVTATSVADNTKSANAAVTVNPPPPVSVTVTPGTATIGVNATQQFTATVQNTTNTGVTWAVDTIAGGNATVGTITGAGNTVTYTAPATTGPHTVTATSVADTTQSGSATVTVAPVSVALSPGTATLAPNATQQFTATVQNTSNTGVTWVVDTFPGGSAAVGTITGTGNTVTYTAPATAG